MTHQIYPRTRKLLARAIAQQVVATDIHPDSNYHRGILQGLLTAADILGFTSHQQSQLLQVIHAWGTANCPRLMASTHPPLDSCPANCAHACSAIPFDRRLWRDL